MIDWKIINEPQEGDFFKPSDLMNRAEICKILVKSTGVPTRNPEKPSFNDVTKTDWFYPYVETAKFYGWMNGDMNGFFSPGNSFKRAEIAKTLVNAFGFEVVEDPSDLEWYDKYVRVMTQYNLFPYEETEYFSILDDVGRAEMTDQLYRFMVEKQKIWDGSQEIENVYEK